MFLTLCQICSHGCTIGTIGTMEFEHLNFSMFGLVWLGLGGFGAKMLNLYRKCNGLERNLNGLERTIYVPIMTILPVFLIKIGVMVLKEIQDPLLFCRVLAVLSKNG